MGLGIAPQLQTAGVIAALWGQLVASTNANMGLVAFMAIPDTVTLPLPLSTTTKGLPLASVAVAV